MYKIIAIVSLLSLAGCATPQQNAMLGGSIVGAAIGSAVASPPPPVYQRLPVCRTRAYIDQYGRLFNRTVCR